MIRDLRIAVIGAGVMGEAMISGMLRKDLVAPDQIIATELREDRRNEIAERYGVQTTDNNVTAVRWAQVAVFSVKPQTLPKILPDLRGTLDHGELVISIVAGAPIRHFADLLAHPQICLLYTF
jgi:pyrroline-5-carboxylate reductase